jgi:hypothetical protein
MSDTSRSTGADAPPPSAIIWQMSTAYWVSQSIYVAAKLGIADLLEDSPKSIEELAKVTATHQPSLYRVLRALASVGVFSEDEHRRFGLTRVGTCLQTDAPDSMRSYVIFQGEPSQWRAWEGLLHSVKTGEPAFDHIHGMGALDYWEQNPEAGRIFDDAMIPFALQAERYTAIAAAYDFSGIRTVVDVGGRRGRMLVPILKANPSLRGILFDLPDVVKVGKGLLAVAGVADRCEAIGGDFFEAVPAGGDAYILSEIAHDYDDDLTLRILRNCHRAMAERGKLLVVELVVPLGSEPSVSKLLDVQLLMMNPGGRERTEAEFCALFETAGFRLTRIIPMPPARQMLIEGVRV